MGLYYALTSRYLNRSISFVGFLSMLSEYLDWQTRVSWYKHRKYFVKIDLEFLSVCFRKSCSTLFYDCFFRLYYYYYLHCCKYCITVLFITRFTRVTPWIYTYVFLKNKLLNWIELFYPFGTWQFSYSYIHDSLTTISNEETFL